MLYIREMSRVKKVRVVKKKSKVDQALSIAKRNRAQIKLSSEVVLGKTVTHTDPFNATPIVDMLNDGLSGGEDFKNKMRSLQLRGTIKRNVASTLIDDWRVDIVLDRNPQGIEVTPLLVYGTATPTIGEMKNHSLKKRFKLLRTLSGVFGEGGNGVGGVVINVYLKLNLVCVAKTTTTWTQAGLLTNAIYLIYWTSASANQPIPALKSRIMCDSGD